MSAPKRDDAGFRYTESGQDYLHYLGTKLRKPVADTVQRVDVFRSADLTTERRIAIGSGVQDLRASLRYDGMTESLRRFLAAARRGASLEYFPSLSNPSESYPCVLVDDSGIQLDADFWWERRDSVDVVLRRIDGGSWVGVTEGSLFYYRAGNSLPGETFVRSGVGTYVDELGVVQDAAANIIRTTWVDGVPYTLLEPARTNLVSSDDLTAWTASGTPVVTGSIDDPAGGTSAYTVEDNDGAAAEYIYRNVTFTGDAVKGFAFVVRENTMASSGNQGLIVRDVTAATVLLNLGISAWTSGEPTVSASTGTYLGKRYIGNGYWAVYGLPTSVTAANTNRAEIYPATTVSATGSIDVYRGNAFDALTPSFSVMDASDVRGADSLYADFTHVPQAMTVYLSYRVTFFGESGETLLHVGGPGSGDDPRLVLSRLGTNRYQLSHDNGTAALVSEAVPSTLPAMGDTVELVGTLASDGSVQLSVSLNGGVAVDGTASAANALQPAWSDPRVWLGSVASLVEHSGLYGAVKILPGGKTLAEMRAA